MQVFHSEMFSPAVSQDKAALRRLSHHATLFTKHTLPDGGGGGGGGLLPYNSYNYRDVLTVRVSFSGCSVLNRVYNFTFSCLKQVRPRKSSPFLPLRSHNFH